MAKFIRTEQHEVEAEQWDGTVTSAQVLRAFVGDSHVDIQLFYDQTRLDATALNHYVFPTQWVVKNEEGDFEVLNDDIFRAQYHEA